MRLRIPIVVEPTATTGPTGEDRDACSAACIDDIQTRAADTFHGFVPHHEDRVPVEQKIGSVSGEATTPVVAPLQLRHRAFGKRAASEQHPDISAGVCLDDEIAGSARGDRRADRKQPTIGVKAKRTASLRQGGG